MRHHGRRLRPDDHLLVCEVDPGTSVHRNKRDEVFLRVGDENRRLNYAQRRELEYHKGQAWFEATPVADATLEELDQKLVTSYAEAVEAGDARRLVQARGLVDHAGRLTIGLLLLFGSGHQSRYPQSVVRVSRFRGSHRGTGRRQELLSDVRCEGPIPLMLNQAQKRIFRVDILDDRMEIESPGRFPGIVDLNDPQRISRFARNPRIARVCSDLRFGVERGEGIQRIFEEMRLAGLADPEYAQTSGSVRLTLTTTAVDRELESRLPPGGRSIIRAVRDSKRTRKRRPRKTRSDRRRRIER